MRLHADMKPCMRRGGAYCCACVAMLCVLKTCDHIESTVAKIGDQLLEQRVDVVANLTHIHTHIHTFIAPAPPSS